MSITDRRPRDAELEALPEFDLVCRVDDDERPREFTVFPAEAGPAVLTTWLTVDVDAAVPLEDCR